MKEELSPFHQLTTNPEFIGWVRSGKSSVAYPKDLFNQQDFDQKTIQEASSFVENMTFDYLESSELRKKEMWGEIASVINSDQKTFPFLKCALVFLFLCVLGLLAYFHFQKKAIVQTEYAELKRIELPDGSNSVLNSNSTLRFDRNWNNDEVRRVILEGEAFFDVSHTPDRNQFILETKNVRIHVIGTKFVVNSRDYGTQITLEEGAIDVFQSGSNQKVTSLQPGETGFYDAKTSRFSLEAKDIAVHTSWKSGVLAFHHTPIDEIIRVIKENFGYKVAINNKEIWESNISGTIESSSIDNLTTALEGILEVDIELVGDTVYFN